MDTELDSSKFATTRDRNDNGPVSKFLLSICCTTTAVVKKSLTLGQILGGPTSSIFVYAHQISHFHKSSTV